MSTDNWHRVGASGRRSREGLHRRICRIPAEGGPWEPVTPEGLPRSHGTFLTLDGERLLFHSTRDVTKLYEFELGGGDLSIINPPAYPDAAHVTEARDGTITFDVLR